ncbi:MAG: DegT/DnrJ/EryC1/StrS family aminotransferase [candidate division WOR-3 bacterium]
MVIPFVDLISQHKLIKKEIEIAIQKVIDSGKFTLGPRVVKLEKKVARYCGTKYAIGVASGTDALILCLEGLGIGLGDEVITTPYTFFATAEAISLTGAVPVFVDIDEQTFNIDPVRIAEFLRKNCYYSVKSKFPINRMTKATVKAIIPVHLFGQCAEMAPIIEIAESYNLFIIEDAAQSFGSCQLLNNRWQKAGSFGKAGIFSFYPTKNLGALGDGGIIVTSDSKLATKLQRLRNHGQYAENYHLDFGWTSRLDEIQAAILLVKMKYLEKWNRARKRIWDFYTQRLNKLVITPKILANNQPVFSQYVIRTRERDQLKNCLAKNGIETKIYYPLPLHLQQAYKKLHYKHGDFPNAERCAKESLALPIYPGLNIDQIEYICQTIEKFLKC